MDPVEAFRTQALACDALGSPMYAELAARCAQDIEAGGPVREVLAGHEDDPGPSALALRLLGSVHRLVLERRADGLALFYPSVGGAWGLARGWSAFRELVAGRPDAVREWLDRPPQTNEVGRAAAIYGGLLHLPRGLPLRLFEIGSSAGLNLLADRYGYRDQHGETFGDAHGALVIEGAWAGRRLDPWQTMRIVGRVGSDLRPVDPGSTEGRLALTAYVWPDQRERLDRLRAAFQVADRHPAEVMRSDACAFLDALGLREGTTTVAYHSVMWQYLSAADQAHARARLEDLGGAATRSARLAHLRLEPARRAPGREHEFLVSLTTWPGGDSRVLGSAHPHGVPTTWE